MPVPATIQIRVGGTDITNKVLFSTATFQAQASGGVGTFSFSVKDVNRTLSFTTGKEVILTLDGKDYFGGYLMRVGAKFAFPAVNTRTLSQVTARQFTVAGVNYNVLFDRLVTRNPANYLEALNIRPGSTPAGDLVEELCANYLDIPAGFDTSTYVDPVAPVLSSAQVVAGDEFIFRQQGDTFRQQMMWVTTYNGAIFYFDAARKLHFHAPEKVFSRWGFSDRPNRRSVLTSQSGFTGATYGFREMETNEDLSDVVNDILVWGGSPFAAYADPSQSGVVFARRTNQTSIASHGRWQKAEVAFGELGGQEKVDARADAIVPPEGTGVPPGLNPEDGIIRNQSVPAKTLKLVWFAHDVPTLENGTKDHLTPGQIVTTLLYVHGTDIGHPLILTLPLRRVSISFPSLPHTSGGGPKTYARFEGEFGLSLNDPKNIWEAIINRQTQIRRVIDAAGGPDVVGAPGGVWQGAPAETPNGSRQAFTLTSNGLPITYVAGTSEVYLNGLRFRQGADYQEDANNGKVVIFDAPPVGTVFWIMVRLAG